MGFGSNERPPIRRDPLCFEGGGPVGGRQSEHQSGNQGFYTTFGSSRNIATTGEGGSWRYRRLEFPVFNGENPDGWIMRVERYFAFYRLSEEEKIEAAVVGLDGDALLWFQWENQRRPITRWVELKDLILRHFRPLGGGNLYEQWLAVSQVGTVEDYRRKFV